MRSKHKLIFSSIPLSGKVNGIIKPFSLGLPLGKLTVEGLSCLSVIFHGSLGARERVERQFVCVRRESVESYGTC